MTNFIVDKRTHSSGRVYFDIVAVGAHVRRIAGRCDSQKQAEFYAKKWEKELNRPLVK